MIRMPCTALLHQNICRSGSGTFSPHNESRCEAKTDGALGVALRAIVLPALLDSAALGPLLPESHW